MAEPTSGWNKRLESVILSLYDHTFTVVMLTGQNIMILSDFFFGEGLTHSVIRPKSRASALPKKSGGQTDKHFFFKKTFETAVYCTKFLLYHS